MLMFAHCSGCISCFRWWAMPLPAAAGGSVPAHSARMGPHALTYIQLQPQPNAESVLCKYSGLQALCIGASWSPAGPVAGKVGSGLNSRPMGRTQRRGLSKQVPCPALHASLLFNTMLHNFYCQGRNTVLDLSKAQPPAANLVPIFPGLLTTCICFSRAQR